MYKYDLYQNTPLYQSTSSRDIAPSMPVPVPVAPPLDVFPALSKEQIDSARTSSWIKHRRMRRVAVPAVVIDVDALGEREEFMAWLAADSIFMPSGEATVDVVEEEEEPKAESSSSLQGRRSSDASSSSSSSSSSTPPRQYHLPNLTRAITETITRFGGSVFPKLNWTAPQDAAFILPQTGGPLRCYSVNDVYLLLKSSDIIHHDLDRSRAYDSGSGGLDDSVSDAGATSGLTSHPAGMDGSGIKLELVLKPFIEMNPSREMRCFVRDNVLVGISQRDTNFYDHLQDLETRSTICETIRAFWEDELLDDYDGGRDYVFDVYLSSDFTHCTLVDINPYRPSTDPLLFSYPELLEILVNSRSDLSSSNSLSADTDADIVQSPPRLPILRVIDSRSHPAANRAAPAHGTNMMPIEMVEMSQGRSMGEFASAWQEAVAAGIRDD